MVDPAILSWDHSGLPQAEGRCSCWHFGTVCLVGGVYLLLKQPLYQSGASLVLHFESQTVPNIDRTMTPPSQQQGSNEHREILYSDADILRSPDLTRGVIGTIGLARLYPQIAAMPYSDRAQTRAGGAGVRVQLGGRRRRSKRRDEPELSAPGSDARA